MPTYTPEERAASVQAARDRIAGLKIHAEDDGRALLLNTGGAVGYLAALLKLDVIDEAEYVDLAEDIARALSDRLAVERAAQDSGRLSC
jgi:hypothetical protein